MVLAQISIFTWLITSDQLDSVLLNTALQALWFRRFSLFVKLLIQSVSQWLGSEGTTGNTGKDTAKGRVKQRALFSSKKAVVFVRGDFSLSDPCWLIPCKFAREWFCNVFSPLLQCTKVLIWSHGLVLTCKVSLVIFSLDVSLLWSSSTFSNALFPQALPVDSEILLWTVYT